MKHLIDNWHVCPYEDSVDELFACLKNCAESYLNAGKILTTKTIINIVQDLRVYLNPQNNKNLVYFTDVICDHILYQYKNIDKKDLHQLSAYIHECEMHVYSKL